MRTHHFTNSDRRRRLVERQLLDNPDSGREIVEVVRDLVALHSSDPVSVFLSIAARMPNSTIETVDAALYDDRSLIRHHAMRRTLWVTTPEMLPIVHAACSTRVIEQERKRTIRILGGEPSIADPGAWMEQAVARIVAHLDEFGPLTTRQIGEQLPELAFSVLVGEGTSSQGRQSTHSRVLLMAGLAALVFRDRPVGTWVSSQYRWTTRQKWGIPDLSLNDTGTATADLVRHWLARFGPGTIQDVRWWSGLTVQAVRTALFDIDAQEVSLESDDVGFVLPGDIESAPGLKPSAKLLPGLDPTPMGWKQRGWYLDETAAERVFDRNGNVGPTIWVAGEIVGGWVQQSNGDISTELYRRIDPSTQRQIDAEIERMREFVGDTRYKVRFPSRNQTDLLRQPS